jgi:DNA uptake protein ComE-like DNA-binding protein
MIALATIAPACGAAVGSPQARRPSEASPLPEVAILEALGDRREGDLPVVREVPRSDPRRSPIDRALERPFLRWVLARGADAARRARARCTDGAAACDERYAHPPYFVLRDAGNEPRRGLAFEHAGGADSGVTTVRRGVWYVEIDPAETAILGHEYGHVMMFEALGGDLPTPPKVLPHTTSAITDTLTAFTEGWAIHFETLAGDQDDDPALHRRTHRDAFPTGAPDKRDDTLLPVRDLMTYAQGYRRYECVKESCFAFLPRVREALVAGARPTPADVVDRWTDSTYDPARLRSLEQMVASEGVVAALFYRLATSQSGEVPLAVGSLPDAARYSSYFDVFPRLSDEIFADTPPVFAFLELLLERAADPAERRRIARTALEVLHYTPVIPDAPRLYAELHAAGHRMDVAAFHALQDALVARMVDGVERLIAHPEILRHVAKPPLWIENRAFTMTIPALEVDAQPLLFDLNTAVPETLMTLPGVEYAEATALLVARAKHGGFRDLEELAAIPRVRPETLRALREMRQRSKPNTPTTSP